MSIKQKKVKFASDMFVNFAYDDSNNTLTINNYLGNPLKINIGSGNIQIHNDTMEINNDKATLQPISNIAHTTSGDINIINITFKFTVGNEPITDNSTYLKLNGDFELPEATFLLAYDITTATPNQSIFLICIGNNIFTLYGAQANHTYAGTFNFSYII